MAAELANPINKDDPLNLLADIASSSPPGYHARAVNIIFIFCYYWFMIQINMLL